MKNLFTLMLLLPLAAAAAEPKRLWADSFLGKKAPELVVESWIGTKPETKGKFVLVDFWATWCGPCRKAIPELNTLHKEFGDRLVVIGLSDEERGTVEKFANPKIEYFSAVDPEARMKDAVGVKGVPHVLLIDPDGVVRWEGFPLLTGHELTPDVVRGILDAKPAAAPDALAEAVKAFAKSQGFDAMPAFRRAQADLNGDGQADAVVLLQGGDWCGTGGCTLVVFRGDGKDFVLVSSSSISREPIRVAAEDANGWKTLIVDTKGLGDVLMPFDGKAYPPNPSLQPAASPEQVRAATVLLE